METSKVNRIPLPGPFSSSSRQHVLQFLCTESCSVGTLHIELHQELLKQNLQVGFEGCIAIGAQCRLILLRLCRGATAGSFPVLTPFGVLVLLRDFGSNFMALHVVFACSQNGMPAFTEVARDKVFKVLKQQINRHKYH